ncbi:methylthioribulose 1-phosphate dehydratase [Nocardia sp. NPDC046763]|uniref:methylthioribulose 1-phosphate dehydratase n=1 Tax=Nocardia sp. NPDC046763 TaxID=3155256 RepID=UPI0033F9BA70
MDQTPFTATPSAGITLDESAERPDMSCLPDGSHAAGVQIAALAHDLYARGWMPGTAGNISVRQGDTAVITVSGLSKGELSATDMVRVKVLDSRPVPDDSRPPSAETAIHTAIYRAGRGTAVVHVHPPYATALSIFRYTNDTRSIEFSGYELIKGLGGTRPDVIEIPMFPNHAEATCIGAEVEKHLIDHPDAPPVLFIAGHGITTWGENLARARDRAECLEAISRLTILTGRREIQCA